MKHKRHWFCLAACLAAPQVMAQDIAPHFDMRYKLGNKRQITSPEIFIPLQQDSNSVLFADIRAMFDGDNNKEGNLGLGYRQMNGDHILGVYSFFDRRKSAFDRYFSQATFGAEMLTENWDFRVNGYVPLTDKKLLDSNAGINNINLQGNQAIQNITGSSSTYEETLGGFDAEVGYQFLPGLRGFVGGYNFHGDADDITGFRGRFQYDVNDYLRLGLEYQRDDVRGENRYAEIRVRIPFGANAKSDVKGLRKRLAEPVVRDIDIVTAVNRQSNDTGPAPIINTETGNAQKLWYVDNSAAGGGDGSVNTPFNTLASAFSSAGVGDIIYVNYGNGTSSGQNAGYTMTQNNLQLIGSGTNLVFNNGRLTSGNTGDIVIGAGSAPVVASGGSSVINVGATNNVIAGLELRGASGDYAIKNTVNDVSGLVLDSLTIRSSQSGISLNTVNSSTPTSGVTMRHVDIAGVSIAGMLLQGVNNLSMHDIDVEGTQNATVGVGLIYSEAGNYNISMTDAHIDKHAFGFYTRMDSSATATFDIDQLTSSNALYGLYTVGDATAAQTLNINHAVIQNNFYGVNIGPLSTTTVTNINMDNSTISNNLIAGVNAVDQFTLTMNNSTVTNPGATGIQTIDTNASSSVILGGGTLVTGNNKGYVNQYSSSGVGQPGLFSELDGTGNNVTGNTQNTDISSF